MDKKIVQQPATCSHSRAWMEIAAGAFSIWLMGGVVFGIASLFPVMFNLGILSFYCQDLSGCLSKSVSCCDEQQLHFTFLSSLAFFAADGGMLLYGEVVDRAGPRLCLLLAMMQCAIGMLLLSLELSLELAWVGAFLCLGGAGPGIFVSVLFLSEKYPHMHARITALAASMWDGSSLVLLCVNKLYFHGFKLHFISWAWLCLSIAVSTFVCLSLPTQSELMQIRRAAGISQEQSSRKPLWSFLSRSDTILLLGFMSAFNLECSFYITSFADYMAALFDEETAAILSNTFNVAFPVGGLLTSTIMPVFLERYQAREDIYIGAVVFFTIFFSVCNAAPLRETQLVTALTFGPIRTIQWSCYFQYLSLPHRYPQEYFGRLLGYGNLVIALFGDLLAFVLNAYVNSGLFSKAISYAHAHLSLLTLMAMFVALPVHLRCMYHKNISLV